MGQPHNGSQSFLSFARFVPGNKDDHESTSSARLYAGGGRPCSGGGNDCGSRSNSGAGRSDAYC
jgi:hypothetical protein